LPYEFIAGEVARSAQVNENFAYLMDTIGQSSVPGRIEPLGKIIFGPRRTGLITASQDTGGSAGAFFQLSWNAAYNKKGTSWVFSRTLAGERASALRVGTNGLEFFTTSATAGNLNSQMIKPWGLRATIQEDFMYLEDSWHIQNRDSYARNVQDYRLTTVLLENPVPIYAKKQVGSGTSVLSAFDYGIPRHAKAIIIYAHVTAANNSGAGMHFYERRGPGNTALNMFRGFVVHAPITGNGLGMRAGGQGIVPLGQAQQLGGFVIYRTSAFALANVYITGYLT
jgi:hypothetical protein